MDKQYLNAEFDRFFEFTNDDKSQVSSVSAKLFAEHIAYPLEKYIAELKIEFSEDREENTKFRAKAAELEADLAAARQIIDEENKDHIEQLAASQLRETQLREALKSCFEKMRQMCLNGEWYDPDKAIDLAWNALAIPTDTNALDAYVSEKVKEAMK